MDLHDKTRGTPKYYKQLSARSSSSLLRYKPYDEEYSRFHIHRQKMAQQHAEINEMNEDQLQAVGRDVEAIHTNGQDTVEKVVVEKLVGVEASDDGQKTEEIGACEEENVIKSDVSSINLNDETQKAEKPTMEVEQDTMEDTLEAVTDVKLNTDEEGRTYFEEPEDITENKYYNNYYEEEEPYDDYEEELDYYY